MLKYIYQVVCNICSVFQEVANGIVYVTVEFQTVLLYSYAY